MSHDFKVGDIAVVIHSETGNVGKMVRITAETALSDFGHDLMAQSLNADGLMCIWVTEDGQYEEIALTVMELPMRSKNLCRVS